MKILFIHQNFPGQFKHLAPALAHEGHEVAAMTMQKVRDTHWNGVSIFPYSASRGATPSVHPWVSDLEAKTIRGEACFRAALRMKARGYEPDAVVAHPGWGESMFVKEVWPATKLGLYCEYFYRLDGADSDFDPEFSPADPGRGCRLRLKNVNNLMHFDIADAGLSPTEWQASTFPEPFRNRITVAHDGIDTQHLAPARDARFTLRSGLVVSRTDEVVTFVNRNLEPYRGYPIFMRALPEILRRRPAARVMVVGGDGVSYGTRPPGGSTWKEIFIEEARRSISDSDWERVHFLGNIPYRHFVALLQVSSVHVYLTYPFVLSWSLLEAMSVGCAVVASDTRPLHEVVAHGETGRLFDFFSPPALVQEVCALLDDPTERARLGRNAREFATSRFDLKSICLPRQMQWVRKLREI